MKKSKVISGTQEWSNDNDGLVQSIDWSYNLEISIPDTLLVPDSYVNATVRYSSPWAGNVYRNPDVSYFADSWGLSFDINTHLASDPRLSWDNPATDTWSLAESNIAAAFALQSPPVTGDWKSRCIVYCIDKDHFGYGSDMTRTVQVYVDGNGYLSNVPLLGEFKRYVNPDTDFTTIGVDTYPGVISVKSEFDWSYFPFCIRKGNEWKSCNRSGGNVRKCVGGFADSNASNRKNTLFENASYPWPTVFTRHGSWMMSPKIGNE